MSLAIDVHDAGLHPIDVRVEAPSPEAFARAYEGHLGPRSIFVPADQQPALGARVALTLVTGDGTHLLDVKGRVTWRYEKGRAPPGRKAGFGLELLEAPVGLACVIEAMKTAPSPAFAPPGSRVPPVGVTGRPVPVPSQPAVRPLPMPMSLADDTELPQLAGTAYSVRRGRNGLELAHLERFSWPASGTSRELSHFPFDEPTDDATDSYPVLPELEVGELSRSGLRRGELASFEDDVTDPGRVSRFVAAAIASSREPIEALSADPPAVAPGPPAVAPAAQVETVESLDPSLETMDDLEPLYVRSEESDDDDETSTDAQIPVATEDVSVSVSEEARADPLPIAASEEEEPESKDEEDPSRVLTASRSQAPKNERALLVSWPGRTPEVAVEVGAALPVSVRREVGTGGARHVEVGVFETQGSGRALLGIARFDVEKEGAVFEVEVRVDADGQLVVKASLPEGVQRVVFRRNAVAKPGPVRPPRASSPTIDEQPGLMGKLRRFFGN